nr:ECF transporter S component [Anaerolineae bacterium]
MKFDLNNPRILALTGVMTALVFALTRPIVPTPIGYTHLGDVAIYFTALAFGPWAGMIAGGVGTALADLLSGGYAHFAPLSLLVHGLQGLVVGLIYRQMKGSGVGLFISLLVGGVIVVGGYFLGEMLVPIWGGPSGAVGEVWFNVVQVLVGSVGGLVYLGVLRAYPRLSQMGE